MEGFLEGKWNFGTLKYRMDQTSAENGFSFPPRTVAATLSDLALGVPLDRLEPGLRGAARLPDGPGAAKGALMDLEDLLERAVSSGNLERSKARPERWPELAACLWHIQDPQSWPAVSMGAMAFLRRRGDISDLEPAHDYAEYAASMLHLSEITGAELVVLEQLLEALDTGELEVPDAEACATESLLKAEERASKGSTDEALDYFERALSLRPGSPAVLRRKAELYQSKGLVMAAIGELEALVEAAPEDREGHRMLVSLYRAQNMVREHNLEVRRWKALKEAREERR